MNGSITYYYGRAMTGQGEKQLYTMLIDEADDVTFFVGLYGLHASKLLRDLGYFYVKQGEDIEWFYDPLEVDVVEALYIPQLKKLFLHDKEGVPRPKLLGFRHSVVSFYECYDKALLAIKGDKLETNVRQGYILREKLFTMLEMAKHLHDDWETVNQQGMDWAGLNAEYDLLEKELFSKVQLNKDGQLTHRLLGTLTPSGPRDTVASITKGLKRRLFIKGYPGTGKSSFMKKLAIAAVEHGLEVQIVWCGLDATSIDMVVIPELSFCIFDSTEPHVYFPDHHRPGDEIFDLAQYCDLTEEQEEKAVEIASSYTDTMARAKAFIQQYAEKIREERLIFEDAIVKSAWYEKYEQVFDSVK